MDWTKPIVECVVNVSAGRKRQVVSQISDVVSDMKGVELVHVDIGLAADRTVFTIIGELLKVFSSVEEVYKVAQNQINVYDYRGNHPTVGAVDVVPFIPILNISEKELGAQVKKFAHQIYLAFNVPILYYGQMTSVSDQMSLAQIRKGGAKAAQRRADCGKLQLDVGLQAHPTLGMSCWTTRGLMLAYNINLSTKDISLAKKIAGTIRKMRDIEKTTMLQQVKAIGWYVEEYQCCQISTNLYNIDQCDMSKMFELIHALAVEEGIRTEGSELIGMTPLKGLSAEATLSNHAYSIKKLGLSSVSPFISHERILELRLNLETSL